MLKLSRTRVQSIMCFLVVIFAALNCIQDFSAYTKEFDALGHDSRNERNLDIMHQEQGEDQPAASNSVGSANDVINNISLTTTKHDSSTAVPRQEIEMTAPAASGSTGVHFSGDKVRVFNTSNSNNGATIEEFTVTPSATPSVTPSATPSVTPSATPSASGISQRNENKKEIIFIVMGERKNFKVWFQRLNINNKNHPARISFIYGSYDESVNATEDNVICEQSNELFDCQTLFIPGTTWTQGRNRLAEEALRKEKKRGMKYDYWGFADDDVQLICDECVNLDHHECPESLSLKCWNRFLPPLQLRVHFLKMPLLLFWRRVGR